MKYEGVWISPDGRKIPVVEHLIEIQHSPWEFDLGVKDVRGLSVSGLREVAEDLIRQGWVRYRYLSGTHLFEMHKLNKELIDEILVANDALLSERVVIEVLSPRREYVGTFESWGDRSMLRSWEVNPKRGWRLSR